MREDTRTYTFAAIICISCSLLLSGTAALLKSRQDANVAFDIQKNIVKAFGESIEGATRESIAITFEKHIEATTAGEGLPLYIWKEDGNATKYAFPIAGKGLWSMLYGYLALNADLETVAGITFYQHGETPGLGAKIVEPTFQAQFVGKYVYKDGRPLSFTVAKKSANVPAAQADYTVDAISGATLTSVGVQNLINAEAARYSDYFNSIRGQ